MVVTCDAAPPERLAEARRRGPVLMAGADRVEPAAALRALSEWGAGTVLCEGGPTLLGGLVEAELLDELCITIEPVMGGDTLPVAVSTVAAALTRFRIVHSLVDGSTLFLRYQVER